MPGMKNPKLSIILAAWYRQNVELDRNLMFIRFAFESCTAESRGLMTYNSGST